MLEQLYEVDCDMKTSTLAILLAITATVFLVLVLSRKKCHKVSEGLGGHGGGGGFHGGIGHVGGLAHSASPGHYHHGGWWRRNGAIGSSYPLWYPYPWRDWIYYDSGCQCDFNCDGNDKDCLCKQANCNLSCLGKQTIDCSK